MARKFLYLVAFAIIAVIIAAAALNIWSRELTRLAMVPTTEFVEQPPLESSAYQAADKWYSRPGIGAGDPARWQPPIRNARGGTDRFLSEQGDPSPGLVAVFFIHPTSYFNRASWNAPWGDKDAEDTARLYLRNIASPFNQASEIWAPKYRQATVGAFLTDKPQAQQALDAAYADVAQAFRFFLESVDKKTPIILAGHSQGALLLMRLLRDEVAGKPIAARIAAAYVVGWPISLEHDLPALGLPVCTTAGQPGCIMSWSTYAEPADPTDLLEAFAKSHGYDGKLRGNSHILCTNPLTGGIGGNAKKALNLGALVPDGDLDNGELVPAYVPAHCNERGLLLIGDPPEMGNAVLPGNNYHVYDIPLFWRNLQLDAARRSEAWHRLRS